MNAKLPLLLSVTLLSVLPCAARAESPLTHRAYSTESGMTGISRRNYDAQTSLPLVGPAPATTARITTVAYRWAYDRKPAELRIQLCQHGGRCADVSDSNEGISHVFTGSNPSRTFYFRARVGGQGGMLPLFGQHASVVVNWYE
ncbi:MAG: hypothetical protein BSR46_14435 [Candidatus Dactylopiibacterium carminicum]|nr:flagellar protein FlhE [Candidatus Dactylopiibacterium carminicum]PAS97085.1 MAG: hypothetical protein BSR46_14435 [Candidatus Dactylopiibacterium carminicum]